ncbi:MAG TPA: 5-dehydro-4-deoxy-D-glucuronate isomerase [Chitinophagaceae bacterium]|jgi:4-deoxy-L-threo-5-hexosulose-uronate ketol-isomerase|nr:5-dehydro-4-deoxy-D-glucuronate isomerase [Chitinophagaceae bacterium]
MEVRFTNSPKETAAMTTQELRGNFLVENLMVNDEIKLVYSHYDRIIIGGAKPVNKTLELPTHSELKADFFLERREIGIINVGGAGIVKADDESFSLNKLDCVYLGKGTEKVSFKTEDKSSPAIFYFLSAPAHAIHSNHLMKKEEASPVTIGDTKTANHRTIYKYIHADGIKSCQLVMGLTVLGEGSVWNTMPAHTHTRRMEAYFYFDVYPDHRIIHLMGHPQETRHLIVANHEAIISPPWSIHAGCGTANYSFIWGMGGENYTYTDMDAVAIGELQ